MQPNNYSEWLYLLLLLVGNMGRSFVIDQPALVKTQLIDYMTSWQSVEASQYTFSLLYTFYHIPLILFMLQTGRCMDKYGACIMNLISTAVIFIGTFIKQGEFMFVLGVRK